MYCLKILLRIHIQESNSRVKPKVVLTARKPTHAQKQYFAFVQPRGQTILLLPQMIFVPCRTTSQGQIQQSILSTRDIFL